MNLEPVGIANAFEQFTDQWAPKAIAAMNDYLVKIVRVEGEFVWHAHDDTDELFLVMEGEIVIDLDGSESVRLGAGDLFVVPAGMEHRPRAAAEAKVLLLEPATVVNTGNVGETDLTSPVEWLSP